MNGQLVSLLERARRLAASTTAPVVIGVVGAPGAGKTTLVEILVTELNKGVPDPEHQQFAHVPMDGFHLSDQELTRLGLLDRKGAPETFDVRGYAAALHRLRTPRAAVVYAPGFERTIEQPIAGVIPVYPSATTILTEGNYLLLGLPEWRQVRNQCTEVWYCEQENELRIQRLIQRHVRFGKSRADAESWVHTVDEKNARLIESFRAEADLVVTLAEYGPEGSPAAGRR
ncbi:nucleoside/nucleotide kinase family protein [Pseudarthrobacter sp. MM222]|uniref:nucleoside/nucleotide kinase family protein n=1 Tax=Pseudarthrobacter sp. MM222 TaxID=3018929 RepID=UPI002220AF38|nr:nucleoside/nucleotide kinase family protein [Pseudarthrobacter sp. MM222]CAI3799098.1 Pantothenate kinase [Pseudarthrobacter sp. MM222]